MYMVCESIKYNCIKLPHFHLLKLFSCFRYFINYLLDSTLGLCLIYIFLQISQLIVHCYKWNTLILGEYGEKQSPIFYALTSNEFLKCISFSGNPPQCDAWVGQCGLYILVMVLEKIAIALLVMLDFWHDVRQFILKPVRKYPKVEVALVMLIIPFIINVSLKVCKDLICNQNTS